jgi:hypothetical protein
VAEIGLRKPFQLFLGKTLTIINQKALTIRGIYLLPGRQDA